MKKGWQCALEIIKINKNENSNYFNFLSSHIKKYRREEGEDLNMKRMKGLGSEDDKKVENIKDETFLFNYLELHTKIRFFFNSNDPCDISF